MTNVNIKGLDELIDALHDIENNTQELSKNGFSVPADATEEEMKQIIFDEVTKH